MDDLNPWATDSDAPSPVVVVVVDSDDRDTTASLLRVAQELWPPPDTPTDDSWRSAFDALPDIAALLAQLADSTPPPVVPFSATATAKAMNDALKSTRHFPASVSSPLSRLLASKGSLDWENAIKARQDVLVVSDSSHAGWRVLDKEDRLSTTEDSKPKRATSLLSFWNRRAAPVESEQPTSPSTSHPPTSRAASPSKPSDPTPPTASAPSTVSRFFNRFARTRSAQHTALALSSDDLEFLSDIVPSATDPPDHAFDPLTDNPPKFLSRPSSVLTLGISDAVSTSVGPSTPTQVQGTNYAPNVPVLAPPPSPMPISVTRGPPLSLNVVAPTAAFGLFKESQQSYSPNPLSSSSTLPPPLLPPPPTSPRTPQLGTFPSTATPAPSSTMQTTHNDSHDDDDEFSAFASFPPAMPAPFSHPALFGSPSPPSPPPRRTYERTHYSSSSASSIFSPASVDQLCSTKSSLSTSFESFDDFVSPPLVAQGEKRTPSPPPLPAKRQQPHIDVFPSRVYHAHTPSQSTNSPTVHTSLIHSVPSFRNNEHRRTQSLVDQAAARAGMLWPDSPESNTGKAQAILPPPSSFTPPKMLVRDVDFDLLGGGDTCVGMSPFGNAGSSGEGFGSAGQPIPSPPPSSSTPTPVQTFVSLVPSTAAQPGSLQSVKPRQMGGLSAQDLSFFEGL